MNFLEFQRRFGKTLQFVIKYKSKDEFDMRLADCVMQGAHLIEQGRYTDDGYTLHWALLQLERKPGENG